MKYNNELVSVVTPAYKAAAFVGQTIESVLKQDYQDWEMHVVDDLSPDSTAAVVERYAARDSRVRLIRQERNRGAAMARNASLGAARGRYVAFLDSDDLWLPNKLSRQLAFMKEAGASFSFTAFRRMTQDGAMVGRLISVPSSLGYRQLLKNTAIATSTVMLDRNVTGELRMTPTYYDDLVLWLELMKRGFAARGLDVDLMRYRVVAQSISRSKSNSARQVWSTYRDIEKLNPLSAAWYFAHYASRGWLKYRRF